MRGPPGAEKLPLGRRGSKTTKEDHSDDSGGKVLRGPPGAGKGPLGRRALKKAKEDHSDDSGGKLLGFRV